MIEPIHVRCLGNGPPLVLVHGDFNDGPGAWSRQMVSLAGQHRLIVPDRRGHGSSPREPRPYTIAGDASDLVAAADRAGAEGFHLAGHSYGGLVAIEAARLVPDRIRSLHLIEPPYLSLLPDHPDVASLIARGMEIKEQAPGLGPEEIAAAFFEVLAGEAGLQRMRGSAGWPAVAREAGRFADTEFPGAYQASALDGLRIDVPVRIYTGGRSHPALQAIAARIAAIIPGADLIAVPSATHAVQFAADQFDLELLSATTRR